jgi:16S rRNA (cytidine1402-2'-O)-methyltransferase
VLGEVDLIAAEDPQITGRLLSHFQLTGQLQPFQGLPDQESLLLDHLTRGQTVALVCDAGTPTIADPGARLVRRALKAGHRICSLPGPVAGMVALTASGLSPQRFAFDGFAPRGRADRIAFFQSLQSETRTMILYESPAYLRSTLTQLALVLGMQREIVIATDLTSAHESYWHGTLADASQAPATRRRKGVCTLIIAGRV